MDIAIIGLVGVIIGAVLTAFFTMIKDWWFHRIKKKEDQTYLAIQISCLLERFVSGCFEVAFDDGLCHGQRDKQGCLSVQVSTPKFEPLQIDVNWKSLPTKLMYQILKLPSLTDDANNYISSVWEFAASPPDFEELFDARKEKYAELGVKAIQLIDELKTLTNLPSDLEPNKWASKERLQQVYDKTIVRIAKRDKRNQEVFKAMSEHISPINTE